MNDAQIRADNRAQTVFVVDSDASIRASIEDVLQEDGFTVVGFATTTDALAWLAAGARPDIALVDFWIGDMSGADFCRVVGHMNIGVTCVVMSAGNGAAEVAEELEVLLLTKPFGLDELFEVVRHPLRASELIAVGAQTHDR
jgi:DNA-binding NtrC family response regulator